MSAAPRRPSAAERADRYDLYQQAVQAPEADVEFFDTTFRRLRGRPALTLREDFSGTALLSRTWVESDPRRTALAVDLDGEALAWGREHNLRPAGADVARRVRLVEADVRDVREPEVDLVCAMNFSFCALTSRAELRRYLEAAHASLAADGLLVMELFGGTEAIVEIEEERELDGFTFVWEQASFNPIDHAARCHIHFAFPDGSRLDRAFSYEWRVWTLPEVRELLAEAGFVSSEVHWETVDEDGDGTGVYRRTEEEENQESWLVYVVAAK